MGDRKGEARCGTPSGANRHRDRGEDPCDACARAKAAYDADLRTIGDRTLRSRVRGRAQGLAERDLRRMYPDEYDVLYQAHLQRLYAEHGLSPRPLGRASIVDR